MIGIARVLDYDELWRLLRALGDPGQRAHAERLHVGTLEHRDVHAVLPADFDSDLGHPGGRHEVRGFVSHLAGEVHRVRDHQTVVNADFDGAHFLRVKLDKVDRLDRPGVRRPLVLVEGVQAESHPLGGDLSGDSGIEPRRPTAVGNRGVAAQPLRCEQARHSGVDFPGDIRVEGIALTEARDDDALGGELAEPVYERQFALLAGYVAFGDEVADCAVESGVDC